MKAVVQRVKEASVTVEGKITADIKNGLLILLGVEAGDDETDAKALALKLSGLRIFSDDNDKMNLSVGDIGGAAIVVSNFTLCADCRKGRRPNFENAELPERANALYEFFCACLAQNKVPVKKGVFGAHMTVDIKNDGPVTFIVNSKELSRC